MKFHVMTLFPQMIEQIVHTSIIGRATSKGIIEVNAVDIRDYTEDKNKRVDDYTYGGGAGMLMQAEPVYNCFNSLNLPEGTPVIYMTPAGETFSQNMAEEFAAYDELVFLCGHYEGIDERVLEKIVTHRVSIGDYVLTGGEMPACVCIDAISRLVPGVLGNEESAQTESFDDYLLEYPQYTRPDVWECMAVPEVLTSGNHKMIEEWRLDKSLECTKKYRPDLYKKWEDTHPEYFEKLEKKRKREEAKARRAMRKLEQEKK